MIVLWMLLILLVMCLCYGAWLVAWEKWLYPLVREEIREQARGVLEEDAREIRENKVFLPVRAERR
jgi:hypothetical protein